jgi:hypothetical protein
MYIDIREIYDLIDCGYRNDEIILGQRFSLYSRDPGRRNDGCKTEPLSAYLDEILANAFKQQNEEGLQELGKKSFYSICLMSILGGHLY